MLPREQILLCDFENRESNNLRALSSSERGGPREERESSSGVINLNFGHNFSMLNAIQLVQHILRMQLKVAKQRLNDYAASLQHYGDT